MRIPSLVAPGAVPAHLRASIAVLNAEESVWVAMLDGWTAQQIARNLAASTVEKRRSIVTRFRAFADCYPWSWSTPVVDEFFLELRALHGASHSTVLGYQNALRMFLEYLTDPAYGWVQQCWDRFGDHPTQLLHEWNSARHSQAAMAEPGKRPYTRDEIQDLFDCADDRVMRIRRAGAKGWVAAFRIATIMKTAYAWGLRRNEVRQLDLVDLAANPRARQFGDVGIVYVRHGKAMRGAPPKRRTVLTLPEFDWIVECLSEWREQVRPLVAPPRSTALWPSERSNVIAADSLSRAFNEVKREAGLDDDLDFHSLRRSYVTHLIEDGYDAFFVQQQVGHEHASTTSIYTGLSPDYRARVVDDAIARMAAQAIAKEN
ncbi:tyrosine-type recombinase/integrase [Microbacterium kunmingense]|uniref:tyrosine-type recombinase/integrase n=1 Tax=Microbacterium kunmingense TaxID=2915939 RepID=UPI0020057ABA|nr:site-specific integrase [Microbacterium kunmingense]